MTRDELEFSISQYHDGALPPLETRTIEELLATSAQAREILAEYERLDDLMKGTPAVPSLDWDRLHAHLSQAVADVPDEQAPVVKTYKIGRAWTRYVGVAAAVAASLAIVATVVFRGDNTQQPRTAIATNRADVQIGPPPSAESIAIVQIDMTGIAAASNAGGGTALPAEVRVGPSPQVAGMAWGYNDDVFQRDARVVIAPDAQPAQDGGGPIPD